MKELAMLCEVCRTVHDLTEIKRLDDDGESQYEILCATHAGKRMKQLEEQMEPYSCKNVGAPDNYPLFYMEDIHER